MTDHLGSTRTVIDELGNVVQAQDYYPFGLIMPGRSFLSGTPVREGFTGKERDGETGFDYFIPLRFISRFARVGRGITTLHWGGGWGWTRWRVSIRGGVRIIMC